MSLRDNLDAYWKLDEVSGSRIDVHSGRVLTDINTVTSTIGKQLFGNAAQFAHANTEALDGGDIYQLNNAGSTIPISFSWWQKNNSTGAGSADQFIFSKGVLSFTYVFGVYTRNSGIFTLFTATSITDFSPAVNWDTDTNWHHYVMTYAGGTPGTWTLYKDGVTGGTVSGSPEQQGTVGAVSFQIGGLQNGGTSQFTHDGLIDEFGVWTNRVLTLSEVQALYNNGNGLPYPFQAPPRRVSRPRPFAPGLAR